MTYIIVSDTHDYDVVANKKLILHVKQIDEKSVYTSEIFLMTYAAIEFYIWLTNLIFLFSIFFFEKNGCDPIYLNVFPFVYSLLLENCPKKIH